MKNIAKKIFGILLIIKYYLFFKNRRINKIKTIEETLREIIDRKSSISRFGDGEFLWLTGKNRNSFQDNSENLRKRLLEVIKSEKENHLIGILQSLNNIEYCTPEGKKYWKITLGRYGLQWRKYLAQDKIYYNANITRFYISGIKNKEYLKIYEERFNLLKKIWKERDILIIEGEKTRLGEGNDLFKEAKSVKRIIAPATNAFSKYEEILNLGKKYGKDKLILIALGPTATILAYDLHNIGYQALDIGHIDIEYEWFLRKTKVKIPIKGKYVNEVKEKFIEEFEKDILDKYFSEIIYKI